MLLLSIVVLPFVAPFFLLMAVREAMGLNPYYLTLPYWPMRLNVLWVAALVALYVGYIMLFVDFFRHKGDRRVIDGMVRHFLHDLEPFWYARDLGRIGDYYTVRPSW